MKLKKIGVLSLGYVAALFGLLSGILNDLVTLVLVKYYPEIGMTVLGTDQMTMLTSTNWWLLSAPLMAVVSMFVGSIVAALIYNYIIVRVTGGVEFELK